MAKSLTTETRPQFKLPTESFSEPHPTLERVLQAVPNLTRRCMALGLHVEFSYSAFPNPVSLVVTIMEHAPDAPRRPEPEGTKNLYITSASLTLVDDWLTAIEDGVAYEQRRLGVYMVPARPQLRESPR